VKKQQYFALAMTAATEVKLKEKTCFKPARFLLQIQSQGLQTGWNTTPYTLHSGRLGCDDALCCRLYCDYGGSRFLRNVGIHVQNYTRHIPEERCLDANSLFVNRFSRKCAGSLHFLSEASWNVMVHALKPDFVFRRKQWVHLNRRGRQFSRLLAAEVWASAEVMLDTPSSEVVWRVLATHSIRQFPLQFPSRPSPCAITFQLESTKL
jgi:hypothetical protein